MASVADFADCDPTAVSWSRPTTGMLHNVCHHGTDCRDVVAVVRAPPVVNEAPPGLVLFLDARQVGLPPTFTTIPAPEVELGYLARFAGIHRLPAGQNLSVLSAVPAVRENHIRVQAGDIVTFGFRSDDDSDLADSSEYGSDSPPDHDSDSSTQPPRGPAHLDDDDSSAGGHESSPVREGHSRSPRRQLRGPSDLLSPLVTVTGSVLPGLKARGAMSGVSVEILPSLRAHGFLNHDGLQCMPLPGPLAGDAGLLLAPALRSLSGHLPIMPARGFAAVAAGNWLFQPVVADLQYLCGIFEPRRARQG